MAQVAPVSAYIFAMDVAIERCYSISIDGSPAWRVGTEHLRTVDGHELVKIKAWDQGFIRLVGHNTVQLPKRERFTLAQCDGFKQLLVLRNEAGLPGDQVDNTDLVEKSLFGDGAKQIKKAAKKSHDLMLHNRKT